MYPHSKMRENVILGAAYVSQITGQDLVEILETKTSLSELEITNQIDKMITELKIDREQRLTALGREQLKIVLAGGVFDIIHPGHIHTLNAAAKLGNVLVVVVATDNTTVKMKKRRPLHSQEQRRELVSALGMVDLCVIGQEDDIFKTVNMIQPQIIALGYDQTHQEKSILEGCKRIDLDVRVARLESPIPDDSSSKIQQEYGSEIHGL